MMKVAINIIVYLFLCVGLFAQAPEKMTCAAYMGWFPPYSTARGIVNPSDFSILPMTYTKGEKTDSEEYYIKLHREELKLMAEHGWNTIGVDGLFYRHSALANRKLKHDINRQLQLMDYFSRAAAGLPKDSIKMVPFLEFIAAYKQMTQDQAVQYFIDNMELMLKKYGSSDFWRKIDGRPAVMIYVANYFPIDFWRKVMNGLNSRGNKLFWIMELEGLDAALYGTYDHAALKPYLELFDGVYNFGCSGLLESATFPSKTRVAAAGLKAEKYLGATLWPGYLSDRPYSRNLIGHDGTRFLRKVWDLTSPAKPDFLHWVFNDYKEATTLTLTFSSLSSRLEIAQRFLSEFNNTPLPDAKKDTPQSVLSYRKALYSGEPLTLEFLPLPVREKGLKGKIKITLLDEKYRTIGSRVSPDLSFDQMKDYCWENALIADHAKSRIIRVKAEIILSGGKRIAYFNLPDVAVVSPLTSIDQLYYNIPLHRMASADRKVKLIVNGKTGGQVMHEGLRRIDWNVAGPNGDAAMIAIARSGHSFRKMSPQDVGGVKDVMPGQGSRNFRLYPKNTKVSYKYLIAQRPTDSPDGEEYYQVLAQFHDGTWSYSPTVFIESSFKPSETWARWVFMHDQKVTPEIEIPDRNYGRFNLTLPKLKRWPFVLLKGEGRVLQCNGDLVIKAPMNSVPYGPVTLETVFCPDEIGRRQYLAYQQGSQATLYIDKEGYAMAARLPMYRKHPNPDVTVRSKEKLKKGKWYQAVITFNGFELKLYLNGTLQGSSPCTGTRSSEGFYIGGTPTPHAMINIPGNLNYNGELLRMTVIGRPWTDNEVHDTYARLKLMPFWNNL